MNSFCLMDGAMAYTVLGQLPAFQDPQTPWIAALTHYPSMRLAGPLLLDCTQVPEGSAQALEIAQAQQAFAHNLHWSMVRSALSLQQLAQHLRCFTVFNDSDAEPYGLRLADCRVLHYLPQILTLPQWQALTAPMCAWQAHTRAGEIMVFPFERDRDTSARNDAVPQPLQLNAAQIAALMEASEPDSLFAHLHWAPEDTKPAQWQLNYDIAQRCIQVWQQYAQENPQRCDRRVLFGLTKQALATQGVWLHQPLKVEQILQEIAEKIS